jgi:hypothetical protein
MGGGTSLATKGRSPKDFQMDNPVQESEANAARGKRGFLLLPELRSSSTPSALGQ